MLCKKGPPFSSVVLVACVVLFLVNVFNSQQLHHRRLSPASASETPAATPLASGGASRLAPLLNRSLALQRRVADLQQQLDEELHGRGGSVPSARNARAPTAASTGGTAAKPPKAVPAKSSAQGNPHRPPPSRPVRPKVQAVPPPLAAPPPSRRDTQRSAGVVPIVVFTYARHDMLRRTLDTVLKVVARSEGAFQVYVSQDGNEHPEVTKAIMQYGPRVTHLRNERNTNCEPRCMERDPVRTAQKWANYYAIAHHYKWAIDTVFQASASYDAVIVLEEDMQIAPDALDYLLAAKPILLQDPSLYCVSLWNDNGKAQHVRDKAALYRTDFFPGLGWMTSRDIWLELSAKWPPGFWDDWMRQPEHRKDRACIRPEVSRSFTFGDRGTSGGQFWRQYLKDIKLADDPMPWGQMNLTYLLKGPYDAWFTGLLRSAKLVRDISEVYAHQHESKELKLLYGSPEEFVMLAKQLQLMADFKDHVPRTAYMHGVVTFRYGSSRVHLVPMVPLY